MTLLLHALVHARRRLAQLLLLIAGEGPALLDLKSQVHRLGLTNPVRFLGYLDCHQELPDGYPAAAVFVFASHTETPGLVLLETMAQSCPVVAQSVMGTADILRAGRGCLVAPNDAQAFAQAMLQVLEDAQLRTPLASEAQAYAREWSDHLMAQRLTELYAPFADRKR